MKSFLIVLFGVVMVLSVGLSDAGAAKKKTQLNRDNYSAEQRKKIYDNAWKLCRKKYAMVERVEVNYRYNRILCYAH